MNKQKIIAMMGVVFLWFMFPINFVGSDQVSDKRMPISQVNDSTTLFDEIGDSVYQDGFKREYYTNGELFSESNCIDEKATGVYREYYRNGNLKKQVHFSEGMYHGVYQDFCEDGTLHASFKYDRNKRDGMYKLYYPSGELEAEGLYVNGKEEGPHQVYYKNGNLAAQSDYLSGKEDGLAVTYYEDGGTWEEISYENGVRHGAYREYHPSQVLKREVFYKDGKIVRSDNYDTDREVFLQVVQHKSGATIQNLKKENTSLKNLSLCRSDLLGVEFLCNAEWKLDRGENYAKIIISSDPLIIMSIEQTGVKISFASQLYRNAVSDMDRYSDNFGIEKIEYCDREALRVAGFDKNDPNIMYLDYYLSDHAELYAIKFSFESGDVFKQNKKLIEKVTDSFAFVQDGEKYYLASSNDTDGTCRELLVEAE